MQELFSSKGFRKGSGERRVQTLWALLTILCQCSTDWSLMTTADDEASARENKKTERRCVYINFVQVGQYAYFVTDGANDELTEL